MSAYCIGRENIARQELVLAQALGQRVQFRNHLLSLPAFIFLGELQNL